MLLAHPTHPTRRAPRPLRVPRPRRAPVPRRRTPLPPHHWYALRILDVLAGDLPLPALLGHLGPEPWDRLAALAPPGPLPADAPRPRLRHCAARPAGARSVEAWALAELGPRVHALAYRLDPDPGGRLRLTALDLPGPLLP
ncbi:Rv3235 family protein [Streptomyces sp. BI20]|uniref:Rv3235 family protein n=1 Tax=Streptomyces sp. BI20 TaxID=3403460 RepID=UPI003C7498F4